MTITYVIWNVVLFHFWFNSGKKKAVHSEGIFCSHPTKNHLIKTSNRMNFPQQNSVLLPNQYLPERFKEYNRAHESINPASGLTGSQSTWVFTGYNRTIVRSEARPANVPVPGTTGHPHASPVHVQTDQSRWHESDQYDPMPAVLLWYVLCSTQWTTVRCRHTSSSCPLYAEVKRCITDAKSETLVAPCLKTAALHFSCQIFINPVYEFTFPKRKGN